MKSPRQPRQRDQAARALFGALLALENEAECRRFLEDLCTPAELEALIDRWSVVPLLEDGLPYRRIHELTGVSVTTIGRVARCLGGATGGYRAVLNRLGASG
jgi:TrpR-related protein YerC/YecD